MWESTDHLFLKCEVAMRIWSSCSLGLRTSANPPVNITTWLKNLLLYLMEEDGYEAILLDVSLMSGDNFEPELVAYTIFEVLYPHTQKDLTRIIAAVESVKVENTAVEETATKKESKPRKTTKSKKD